MAGEQDQTSEFHRSRQPASLLDSHVSDEGETQHPPVGLLPDLPGLMLSAAIEERCNAPVRAEGLRQMQRTHGNRAMQRFIQRSPDPAQQAGVEAEQEDGAWPRWLSNITNQFRAMAGMAGQASGGAAGSAPAPQYGPLPPTTPTLTSEPPVYGPAPPAGMAPQSVPAPGQLGHVAPYSVPAGQAQPPAEYLLDNQGNRVLNDRGNPIRTTENEHIIPRGNMEQVTMNPSTQTPDYQQSHYVRDATVRVDRETALNKTHANRGGPTADNARTDALKDRVANNRPINYREDVFEPSIENAKRARDARGATTITDEAIHRGALSQDANLFSMQNTAQSGDIVRQLGSQVDDFNIVPYHGPEAGPAPGAAPAVDTPHTPPAIEGGGGSPSGSGWGHTFRPGGAVDRTLRGANYGFQFFGALSQGQDVGEAGAGALFGGFGGNAMGDYLAKRSPKGGAIDMGINLLNSGLQLAGAPEEVTTVTQTVADATPSSFATSLASNAGRGLYNFVTGDWDALKQQGHDMTHGKAGAPLQGYAVAGEAAYALLSGDEEMQDRIREENASGKRGKLAQWGSRIGKWARGGEYDEWDAEREGGPAARERFLKMQAARPMRESIVSYERAQQEKKDQAEKERFDKEMAEISKQIEKGPAVPGNMLGTAGDPLSAQAQLARIREAQQEDEDGEAVAPVSMRLR